MLASVLELGVQMPVINKLKWCGANTLAALYWLCLSIHRQFAFGCFDKAALFLIVTKRQPHNLCMVGVLFFQQVLNYWSLGV